MFVTLLPVGWRPLDSEDLLARAPAACVRVLDASATNALLEVIYWAAAGRAPGDDERYANEPPSARQLARIDALLEVIEELGRELERRRALGETEPLLAADEAGVRGDGARAAWLECGAWSLLVVARRAPGALVGDTWEYTLEEALDEYGDETNALPPDVRARFAEVTEGEFSFGPATDAR